MSDAIIRCQKITIDQLSYTLNLVFTLAIAALGYWCVLLKDRDFSPQRSAKCVMLVSLVALALAAFSGFTCIFNRLRDVRRTAGRARGDADALSREELRIVGNRTWILFYFHLVSFALGIVALGIVFLLTYGGKLK